MRKTEPNHLTSGGNAGTVQGTRQKFEKLRALAGTIFGRKKLSDQVTSLENKLEQANAALKKEQRAKNADAALIIAELNDKILGLEDSNAELERQVVMLTTDLEEARDEKAKLSEENTALREANLSLLENARELAKTIDELNRKIDMKDTTLLELTTQLKETRRKVAAMEKAIEATTNALRQIQESVRWMRDDREEILKEFSLLIKSSSMLFSSGAKIDDALKRFVETITRDFKFSNCAVLIYNQEEKALEIRALSGYLDDTLMQTARIKPGDGITGTAFITGKTKKIGDVTKCENYVCGDKRTQSEIAVPIKAIDGAVLGVLDAESMKPNDFNDRDISLLESVAMQISIAMELQAAIIKLNNHYVQTISAFVITLEGKSPYTSGHSRDVAEIAKAIAIAMELDDEMVKKVWNAAILHDIGKIAITDLIINKPASLTNDEESAIRLHPEKGAEIIRMMFEGLDVPVKQHHERLDGSGYPDGLKGDEICLIARIIAVADSVAAIVTDRPYQKGRPLNVAIDEVMKDHDTANPPYDPAVVNAFVTGVVPRIWSGDIKLEALSWNNPEHHQKL